MTGLLILGALGAALLLALEIGAPPYPGAPGIVLAVMVRS